MTSLVLGQYSGDSMVYKGHVTLGVGGESFRRIRSLDQTGHPPFTVPDGNESAVWIEPVLVCTVRYMMKTASGGMRQPVFKGLREDSMSNFLALWRIIRYGHTLVFRLHV